MGKAQGGGDKHTFGLGTPALHNFRTPYRNNHAKSSETGLESENVGAQGYKGQNLQQTVQHSTHMLDVLILRVHGTLSAHQVTFDHNVPKIGRSRQNAARETQDGIPGEDTGPNVQGRFISLGKGGIGVCGILSRVGTGHIAGATGAPFARDLSGGKSNLHFVMAAPESPNSGSQGQSTNVHATKRRVERCER